MSALLWLLRAAVGLTVGVVLFFLSAWSAPDIEVALSPVLGAQAIDAVDRSDVTRGVCFTWRFDKLKAARATDAGWTLRAGEAVYPFQELRTVADSEGIEPGLRERPVRPGQWTRKCVTIPAQLVGRPFRLTGFVEHRTALTGRLWPIRQPTAEVSVP